MNATGLDKNNKTSMTSPKCFFFCSNRPRNEYMAAKIKLHFFIIDVILIFGSIFNFFFINNIKELTMTSIKWFYLFKSAKNVYMTAKRKLFSFTMDAILNLAAILNFCINNINNLSMTSPKWFYLFEKDKK
jgi:hypothetical protein